MKFLSSFLCLFSFAIIFVLTIKTFRKVILPAFIENACLIKLFITQLCRFVVKLFCGLFLLLVSTTAYAQIEYRGFDDGAENYRKNASSNSSLGDSDFGYQWDPDTGSATFATTDVSIPGNFSLPVSLNRTRVRDIGTKRSDHEFADWKISLPTLTYNWVVNDDKYFNVVDRGWESRRCSSYPKVPKPGSMTVSDGTFYGTTTTTIQTTNYHSGIRLTSFDGSGGTFLEPRTDVAWPNDTKWVTETMWRVSCVARSGNMTGEGFVAHSPKGYKITFGHEERETFWNGFPFNSEDLWDVTLYPTRIEDSSGNFVSYEYGVHGLTKIEASDGRKIELIYNANGLVAQVISGTRIWQYNYGERSDNSPQGPIKYVLENVTNPDSTMWKMSGFEKFDIGYQNGLDRLDCTFVGSSTATVYDGITIENPFGAKLELKIQPIMNGRLAVTPRNHDFAPYWYSHRCMVSLKDVDYLFASLAVIEKKRVDGSNQDTWSYEYEQDRGQKYSYNNNTLSSVKTRSQVFPDGSYETYEINRNQFSSTEGKISKKYYYDAGHSLLREDSYEYTRVELPIGWIPGFSYLSTDTGQTNWRKTTWPAFLTKSEAFVNGDVFSVESDVDLSPSSLSFGLSKALKSYSNVSTTPRETVTNYEHNTSSWILGLPKTITQNGRLLTTKEYDSATGKLLNSKSFNATHYDTEITYNADGTVDTRKDAIGRITKLSDWKRGKPETIKQAFGTADEITLLQDIDYFGQISSRTDAKGQITAYSHDVMGRLTSINPAGSYFIGTNIAYSFPPSGGAVQTVTKGSSVTTITYDGLLRPVLEQTEATDIGWSSYVNTEYDALGRVVFQSQPSASPTESQGTTTTYDGLGRILTQTETASGAQTVHSYHSGHRHSIRDPELNFIHYYSRGYDGPGNTDYRTIYEGSGGRATDIFKNIWGETTRVRQRGAGGNAVDSKMENQFFYYDDQRRLCRYRGTEGGDTVYQYDDAGQMIAYQKGLSNGAPCVTPSGTAKVSMSYDDLGRLKLTDFADAGTPDITRTYDDNGNLLTLNRNGVDWTYEYNELDLLEKETLTIDGLTFPVDHIYNNRGHIAWKKHPTNTQVAFAPDGLGRATQAKWGTTTLADNITYHPSGSVYQMDYGNGQDFTQYLNTRLLPQRLHATGNGVTPLDLTYTYDQRAKITSILDGAVSGNNRSYTYDALGQLKTATGPWGTQSNDYDTFGNITLREFMSGGVTTRTIGLQYDNKNRVYFSDDSAPVGTGWGNSGTDERPVGYDSRGNVTSLGSMSFVYDYSDQPTVINGSLAGTSFNSSGFTYDGNLKRVKSVINGRTIYNVYDSTGSLIHVRKMAHGQEPEERSDYVKAAGKSIARLVRNGASGAHKTYYSFSDHLGSPVATMEYDPTITTAQVAIETERYTPFGIAMDNPNVLSDQAGFTGHIKDSATGLNYMQARYYDPVMGRFLSIDPMTFMETGHPGMFNRYAYTLNDPINLIDPEGMIFEFFQKFFDWGGDAAVDRAHEAMESAGEAGAMPSEGGSMTDGPGTGVTVVGNYTVATAETAANLGVNIGIAAATTASPVDEVTVAGVAAKTAAKEAPNLINSARVLLRSAEEAGPMHNIPVIAEKAALQGERTVVSDTYVQYTTRGVVNGKPGTYEVGVKPSSTGRTETIVHRFFRKDKT